MGNIKFVVKGIKSPKDATMQYYAQKTTYSRIDDDALIERIKENTSVPPGVVRAGVCAIEDSIANFLLNGHSVSFGSLFTLRPQCHAKPVEKEQATSEDTNVGQIRKMIIRASWGSRVRKLQDPANYEFEKVTSV